MERNKPINVELSSIKHDLVLQMFTLDKDRYKQFLCNGYQMQLEDPKSYVIETAKSYNYAY